ncbi:MAG: hypothetical protein ABIS69_01305 [Sediminibacterium sp.]
MANECRIQFYFKTDDLKKLLKANPKAKGLIVSQEISREKPRGSLKYLNIAHIKATVDMGKVTKSRKGIALEKGGDDPPTDESIDGCPFPPGCN